MKRMEKIYTFMIQYKSDDIFSEIEFCAPTQDDAVEMYIDWCKEDKGLDEPYPIDYIDVVYDLYDAEEYGENYGTPEEYYGEAKR